MGCVDVCRLTTGAAVKISGLWKPCPPGKEQTHELQATEVTVVGEADAQVSRDESIVQVGWASLTAIAGADVPDSEEIPHA